MTELIADGPVERYLDDLFNRLAGTGMAGRRAIAEAEDHLRESVAARMAAGATADDAERAAVAAFGSAESVSAALRATHRPIAALFRPAFVASWWIAIAASLAIGASGVALWISGRVLGSFWAAGDRHPVSAARCAQYLRLEPSSPDCYHAETAHHFFEMVRNRLAIGVLGLIAAVAWIALRKRFSADRPAAPLVGLLTAALAGVTAAGLLYMSVPYLGSVSVVGIGWKFTDGVAALVVAIVAAGWALARYRRPVVTTR